MQLLPPGAVRALVVRLEEIRRQQRRLQVTVLIDTNDQGIVEQVVVPETFKNENLLTKRTA